MSHGLFTCIIFYPSPSAISSLWLHVYCANGVHSELSFFWHFSRRGTGKNGSRSWVAAVFPRLTLKAGSLVERKTVKIRSVSPPMRRNGATSHRAAPEMRIALLGTRGIPANYGGFETFAEELSTR